MNFFTDYCANCYRQFEAFGGEYEWTRNFCSLGCYEDSQNRED